MALTATLHRIDVSLQHVDRGVYGDVEVRIAQHPSETRRHLVARAVAFVLEQQEGIGFEGDLSNAEGPAIGVRDLRGDRLAWIDIGLPSAERLHRASKACARVVVYTHQDPQLLTREARTRPVHRLEHIEAYALDPAFLDAVAERLERSSRWELVVTGGALYLTTGGTTLESELVPIRLAP